MPDIIVKEDNHAFRETIIPGLNLSVAELERYIFDQSIEQRNAFAQRELAAGKTHVDSKYADPEYWILRVGKVFESRVTLETRKSAEGVLFRISHILTDEERKEYLKRAANVSVRGH